MAQIDTQVNKQKRGTLTSNEISTFCAQMSMIMKSGISVQEGLAIMHGDMKNQAGKSILQDMVDEVEKGYPLSFAMEATGAFPKYVVDMTEIGEQTGRLDSVMESLTVYYEREEAIAKNIKNAVTYPLVMIGMMIVVILVLAIKVLPIFNQVFIQLGSELTGISRSMMNLGSLIGRYSVALLVVVALVACVGLWLRFTAEGRARFKKWQEGFLGTRNLSQQIASGRFASGLALMMASGLDTDQSLDMVYKLVDHRMLREKITNCKELIAEGTNFSEALTKSGLFTGVYARMVSVGFRTGSVDTVMQKLAERYEEEVDSRINGIVSILEPTLVAVISIIVGMVMLSVMLPLMGIMSSIG